MINTTVLVKEPFIIHGQINVKFHGAFFIIRWRPIGDSPSCSGFHFLTLRTRIFRNHPLPCYFLSLTSHVTGAYVLYKSYFYKSQQYESKLHEGSITCSTTYLFFFEPYDALYFVQSHCSADKQGCKISFWRKSPAWFEQLKFGSH